MLKKTAKYVLLAALASVILCANSFAATELKLGHFAADNHAGHAAAKQFADAVAKRTNGEITVAILHGISGNKLVDQLMDGTVDMSLSEQEHLAKHVKIFEVVNTPFAIKDYAHADRILDGPFKEWTKVPLSEAGLVYLSAWEWGFRQITNSKRPIKTPADLVGLKMRVPPYVVYQESVKAMGAEIVAIPFNEMPAAMRDGRADGQENPINVIYSLGIYDTQKYITMVNYLYNSMTHFVSKSVWEKLTAEQKRIIQEESDKARLVMRKLVRDEEQKQVDDMRAKGVQVDTPDLKFFQDKVIPVYEVIKASVGADNFTIWMKIVDETAEK